MKKPSEMTDQELRLAWFVEVLGWPSNEDGAVMWPFKGVEWWEEPPYILENEESFNRWVLPVMEERLFGYLINRIECFDYPSIFAWAWVVRGENNEPVVVLQVPIRDHRRLRAAVEAAMEIVRGRGEVERD